MPFVDILRCADESFYVGHTNDVAAREKTHNDGDGASHTFLRRPVRVVYFEEHTSIAQAMRRERQLKRWTISKKEALIAGDVAALKSLSKRHKR